MKRLKRYLILLPVLMLAVGIATLVMALTTSPASAGGTVPSAEQQVVLNNADAPLLPTVIATADFAVTYRSVGQLTKAAEAVVRGEVVKVSYIDFNTAAHTKTTLKVTECLKGDLKPGQEITIAEAGGIISAASIVGDKFGGPTAKDFETMVKVQLEGAPLTEVGDKCLYFLGSGSIGVVSGAYYVPLGAFQGRFEIKGSVAERFVPEDWGATYTSLAMAETAIDQTVRKAQ